MNWDYDYGFEQDSNFWRVYHRIRRQEPDANILAVNYEIRAALVGRPWSGQFGPQVIWW